MNHPLETKVDVLRGRLRRQATLFGAGRTASIVLAAAILAGLADYLVRFEDPGLRVLATLAVVGALGFAAYRYLWRSSRVRWSDVELARRVQRRHPALGDMLASAVEFLKQPEDDPIAGSAALRRAVITRATVAAEPLDFTAVASRRPARRSLVGAAAVALCAAALAAMSPAGARVALARLVNPLGQVAWPKENNLDIRSATYRIARGGAFEIVVVDADPNQRLPSDGRVVFRFENADGPPIQEVQRLRQVGDTLVTRRPDVTRSFVFRIEGGDYRDASWRSVEVVEPPAVEQLQLTLRPPAYTGWPPEVSEGNVRALVGTRVDLSGRASVPVRSVVLCQGGKEVPTLLAADDRGFSLPADAPGAMVVRKSGSYSLRVTDAEGLVGSQDVQWEIRAVDDAPPAVTVAEPRDNLFVTPRAAVPVRVTAQDDLALRGIELTWESTTPGAAPGGSLSLYAGPAAVSTAVAEASRRGVPDRRDVDSVWRLESLDLKPGVQLTFRAAAADYRPQRGQSPPLRLTVVTPEELAERLAVRLTGVVEELARVLGIQRTARAGAGDVAARMGDSGRADTEQADRLRGVELTQRQVAQTLGSRSEGVGGGVAGLLADLEVNRIEQPELRARLESLQAEIERLKREPLSAAAREFTSAIKSMQAAVESLAASSAGAKPQAREARAPEAVVSLRRAVAGQDAVIESLERLLAEFGRADSFRRFQRDLLSILRDQEELARRTAALGARTLTKDVKELSPQETADLQSASESQSQLARQLDRALQLMEQALGPLRESDASTAEGVSEALAHAASRGISGSMRTAAASIDRNRLGQAGALQDQAVRALREVLDLLTNRREHEIARLVKRLRDAEKTAAELAAKQESVRKAEEDAAAVADAAQRQQSLSAAAAQQQQLQDELQRLAARLEQPSAELNDAVKDAAAAMDRSRREAQQGRAEQAARVAQEAAAKLDEARRLLAQQQREAEAELAVEQLARLQDSLVGVLRRQQRAVEETKRLDGLRAGGAWTPGQQASLRDLTGEQRLLHAETTAVAAKLAAAEVLAVTLGMAAEHMDEAVGLLQREQTSAATQAVQQAAATRIEQVIESLKPEPPPKEKPKESGGGGGGNKGKPGGPRMPGDRVPDVAQIKLLKLLQEELQRQTAALATQTPGSATPDSAAARQYESLSRRQTRLAELLLDLLRGPTPKGEGDEAPGPDPNTHDAPLRSVSPQATARGGGQTFLSVGEDAASGALAQMPRVCWTDRNVCPPAYWLTATAAGDDVDRELFGDDASKQTKPAPGKTQPPGKEPPGKEPPAKQPQPGQPQPGPPTTPSGADDDNPQRAIAKTVEEMRDAGARIGRADCGPDTQQIQKRIVARLDALLQQAAKRCGECRGGGSNQASQGAKPGTKQGASKPSTGKSSTGATAAAKTGAKSAGNANPNAKSPASLAKLPPDERAALIKQIWGNLPQRERNMLLQPPSAEEFLPEYETLIEEYFRRLAEDAAAAR